MGDIGTALSGLGSGLSDALSGVGSAFSGGMSDMGSAMSSMFSGSPAPATSGTGPGSSFTQSVDPTGSIAAQEAINPPGQAPTAAQSQQGGQQGAQAPKPAPQPDQQQDTGLDQLRKLLQRARGVNPYQTGAGAGAQSVPEGPVQDPLMPSPALGQAGRIDTSGVPSGGGGGLGLGPGEANEPPAEAQGPLARSPRAAAAGQGAVEGATRGGGLPAVQQPEIGPGSPAAAAGVPPLVSALARGAGPLAAGATVMSPTPTQPASADAPTQAQLPADQRNMPYPGQQYSPDPSIAAQPQITPPGTTSGPGDPRDSVPGRGQPPAGGDKPTTKAEYEKWLKAQGVKPSEAKKRADDSNLPTKKPPEERPYHMDGPDQRGVSRMTRDRMGMQGVPQMLGELAQMAMPLLSMAMGGMGGGGRGRFRGFPFGRGGHGRFGGPFMGGHPGGHGSGMWPYHHPGMGWRGFGYHPGGGWNPLHPKYMASMGGQVGGGMGGGGGQQDQMQQILQALGLAPQGQGGQQGQRGGFQQGGQFGGGGGSSGGGGASGGAPPSTTPGQGPNGQPLPYTGQQADQFTRQVAQSLGINPDQASRVLQAESSYGQNYSNNRDPGAGSHGPFQLDIAPGALGQAFMNETGEDPRDPNTWKDQIVFALRYAQTKGWGPWTTAQRMGYGRQPAGQAGKQFAWNYGGGTQTAETPPGTVGTGDSRAPNPDGNVVQKNFDNSPLTVAQQ